jgi:hypothetical protein
MQALHSLPGGERLALAIALASLAASGHPPPQQDIHPQQVLLLTWDKPPSPCRAPLAGVPHPERPAGPSAAGLRMLNPAGAPGWHQPRPAYLPRGIEEPETCYLMRLEAARPTGFYRDALRTYEGMLSRLAWQELPDSLTRVATDVDGQGTLRYGGHDPYSAGNVIGGGDWAADRIVPDATRALAAGEPIPLQNPAATRPWQHMLEAALQQWPGSWRDGSDPHAPHAPHEARCLHLPIDKAHHQLGWQHRWRAAWRIWRPMQVASAAPPEPC